MKKLMSPDSTETLLNTLREISQRAAEIDPTDPDPDARGGIRTQEGTHYHFTVDGKVFRWSVERFSDNSVSLCCTIGVPMTLSTFETIADEHTF